MGFESYHDIKTVKDLEEKGNEIFICLSRRIVKQYFRIKRNINVLENNILYSRIFKQKSEYKRLYVRLKYKIFSDCLNLKLFQFKNRNNGLAKCW